MIKFYIGTLLMLSFGVLALGQEVSTDNNVNWKTVNKVDMLSDKSKLILVDLYTDWCGWCKTMDQTTFKNSNLISYLNTNYTSYKFNAESNENITYNNKVFKFDTKYNVHKLAIYLTEGNLSFPTTLIINPETSVVYPILGYRSATDMEFILKFFNENKLNPSLSFETFKSSFKPSW